MRVVLDTNVVISALIDPGGNPSRILKMVLSRKAELCHNSAILTEYESVALRPKFSARIDSAYVRRFISLLRSIGISFDLAPSIIKLPDESDRIFYDTARESGSILISGNTKHFPKEPFIMLPVDFIKRFNRTKKTTK